MVCLATGGICCVNFIMQLSLAFITWFLNLGYLRHEINSKVDTHEMKEIRHVHYTVRKLKLSDSYEIFVQDYKSI